MGAGVREFAAEAFQEVLYALCDGVRERVVFVADGRASVLGGVRLVGDHGRRSALRLSVGEKTRDSWRRLAVGLLDETKFERVTRVEVTLLRDRTALRDRDRLRFDLHEHELVADLAGCQVKTWELSRAQRSGTPAAVLLALYDRMAAARSGAAHLTPAEVADVRLTRFVRDDLALDAAGYAAVLEAEIAANASRRDVVAAAKTQLAAARAWAADAPPPPDAARAAAGAVRPSAAAATAPDPAAAAARDGGFSGLRVRRKADAGKRSYSRWIAFGVVLAFALLVALFRVQEETFNINYEDFMDNYAVLGLPKDAPVDDVKRTFRQLSLKLHPDRCRGDACDPERFQQLSTAYQQIMDYHSGRVRLLHESLRSKDRRRADEAARARPDFHDA